MKLKYLVTLLSVVWLACFQVRGEGKESAFATFGKKIGLIKAEKIYDADTLTIFQLSSCLQTENFIRKFERELQGKRVELRLSKEQLDQLARQLDEYKLQLNDLEDKNLSKYAKIRGRNKKVDNFNLMTTRYNLQADHFEELQQEFNNEVAGYNRRLDIFEQSCQGKNYYQNDLDKAINDLKK